MDTKPFEDLKPNPKNPRTINEFDFENLKKSIKEFGDLSGIIFNVTTQQLVGGHQRVEAFRRLGGEKRIIYQQKFYEQPNHVGTVAFGYVVLDNEFFPYREVQWPLERETAANIAANRIQGNFDLDLLAEANSMLYEQFPDLLESTGQNPEEIKDLLDATGATGDTPPSPDLLGKLTFKFDPTQAEVVRDALYKSRTTNNLDVGPSVDAEALFLICRDYLDVAEQAETQ